MKKFCIILLTGMLLQHTAADAQQKFYTKKGKITFFSSAPLEDIEAIHKSVTVLLNSETGDLQFALLMKGFEFKKALMQEHFNQKYVESDKYPRSEFKGQITNNNTVNYKSDGTYPVTVKGKLTIHGVTKDIETTGSLTVREGKVSANAVFHVLLADYAVSIPKIHRDNISKTIKITVDCLLEPLK